MGEARPTVNVPALEQKISNASGIPLRGPGRRQLTSNSEGVPQNIRGPAVILDPAGWRTVVRGFNYGTSSSNPSLEGWRIDQWKFNGFPCTVWIPERGILSCWFSNATGHGQSTRRTMEIISTDFGHSWSLPVERQMAFSGTPDFTHTERLFRIDSGPYEGRILWFGYPHDTSAFSFSSYSDDYGLTFSQPIPSYDDNVLHTEWRTGGMLTLSGGHVLVGGYAHTTGGAYYRATNIQSEDGGESWFNWGLVHSGSGAGEEPEEPVHFFDARTGRVRTWVRFDDDQTLRLFESTTEGASYGASPIATVDGWGKPITLVTTAGTVITITRGDDSNYPNNNPIVYVSRDYGDTWERPFPLDTESLFMTYCSMVEVSPNVVAVTYGMQSLPPDYSYGDVRLRYLLDGGAVSPLGGAMLDGIRGNHIYLGHTEPTWREPVEHGQAAVTTLAGDGSAADDTLLETAVNSVATQLNALITQLQGQGVIAPHPNNIATIHGLFEADSIAPQIDDYQVQDMDDLSPGGYDMGQGTLANAPLYRNFLEGIFNGLPSLFFNGSGSSKSLITDSAFSAVSQPWAFIICVHLDVDNGFNRLITSQAAAIHPSIFIQTADYFSAHAGSSAVDRTDFTVDFPGAGPIILAARFSGGDSELRINGRTVAVGGGGSGTITQMQWGSSNTNTRMFSPACCMLGNGATVAEIALVERYFSLKYDIPLVFRG